MFDWFLHVSGNDTGNDDRNRSHLFFKQVVFLTMHGERGTSMPTNNHKKQTASSNVSPLSSQEASTGDNALTEDVNSIVLLLSLAALAQELHGQSTDVVERLCQRIVEMSKGQVQLILPRYQYQHSYPTSSRERPWLALLVEHAGRSYGKLEVAPHPTQPGQTALPYHHVQLLAGHCGLLLYSLETAAYFQRECPPPVKLIEVLTEREQEVLELMCHGYQRKQIATMLGIEEDTIAKMCGKLYTKLGGARTERYTVAAAFILGLSFPIEHLSPEINLPPAQQET
jgi:DNA-binding CsgD family transcriptional regulator